MWPALMLGLIFSPLAALMAFLISYMEYAQHFDDKRKTFLMSLQAAATTFAVFLVLTIIAWAAMKNLVSNR